MKPWICDDGENCIFPFLWLRGEDEAALRHMMRVIREAGIGAVCLESRPHPDFCGDGWWHDLDILLDEAKRLGMKLWILDDSHFPTGYCNGTLRGMLTGEDRSLLRRQVTYRVLADAVGGAEITPDPQDWQKAGEAQKTKADIYFMKEYPFMDDDVFLDAVAVPVGGTAGEAFSLMQAPGGLPGSVRMPEGHWRICGLYLTRNRGPHRDYMNMLSHASCRRLLEAVYEPHYARYADEFGKTILGFFSDEPELGNGHIYQMDRRLHEVEDLPWSDELQACLTEAWGSRWTEKLPYLWEEEAPGALRADVRRTYMDAVTRLVEECFSRQVGDWCRAHGVRYIGHLIEDNNQHTRCGSSLGHYFRGLAGQDMAGIDNIGGQVLPQGEDLDLPSKWQPHRDGTFYHFCLARLAASAAAIEPLKQGRAMCEIFGNYGWQEGVNLEKYQAEHFMVRGINRFVPHAFSAASFPDRDCPPHFYAQGHNPQYRHFGALVRYMERVCRLISGGRETVETAVLYHAEADWSGGASMYCQEPARVLAEHQRSYHFLPADVFDENRYRADRPGSFSVNGQRYTALIVPKTDFLTRGTAEALLRLAENGASVWFVDRPAKNVFHAGAADDELIRQLQDLPCCALRILPQMLESTRREDVRIEPACPHIRVLHYNGEKRLLYLVNEGAEVYRGRMTLPASWQGKALSSYDLWSECPVPVKLTEEGKLCLELEPAKGYFFFSDDNDDSSPADFDGSPRVSQSTELRCFERSVCSPLDYPAFGNTKTVCLPDFPERERDGFYGFVRYETEITFADGQHITLEIDGLEEGIEVFVNGVSLGIQVIPCYRYDLTPALTPGVNRLVIEKATTLEQLLPGKNADQTERIPQNRCGLTGPVRLMYSHSAAQ